jgi:hypothetical protein
MNLGLGNRTELKAWLLPKSQRTDTQWDSIIDAIGLGVAARLEQHCGRKFARLAGDTLQVDAARTTIAVPRYPIETVTSIERRDSAGSSWTALTGVIRDQDDAAGLIWLEAIQDEYPAQLRVTYTGGYWFDDTEDSTGEMPTGAAALPADLKLAWYQQCAHVWAQKDHVGKVLSDPEFSGRFVSLAVSNALTPAVEAALRPYMRLAA